MLNTASRNSMLESDALNAKVGQIIYNHYFFYFSGECRFFSILFVSHYPPFVPLDQGKETKTTQT